MVDIDQLVAGPDLYVTTVPSGQQFAYRLLTMKEYKVFCAMRLNNIEHPFLLYNRVFNRCYVGRADILHEDLPAGISISIGNLIMWLSGDSTGVSDKSDLDYSRSRYDSLSLIEYMKHIVFTAWPAYTIEDVEGWTRPTLFDRFVMAETVLQKRTAYEPISLKDILSPEEAQQKAKKPAIDYARENADLESMGGQHHVLDQDPRVLVNKMRKAKRIDKMEARRLQRLEDIENRQRGK